jgi:hypothetical protein
MLMSPGPLAPVRLVVVVDIGHPWRDDVDDSMDALRAAVGHYHVLAQHRDRHAGTARLDVLTYGTPRWLGSEPEQAFTLRWAELPTPHPSLFAALFAVAGQLGDQDQERGPVTAIVHLTGGQIHQDDLRRSLHVLDGIRASYRNVIVQHVVMSPGVLRGDGQDARTWRGITPETTLPNRTVQGLARTATPISAGVLGELRRRGYPEIEDDALMLVPGTSDDLRRLAHVMLVLSVTEEAETWRRDYVAGKPWPDSLAPIGPATPPGGPPVYADENVQFTVYRP